MAVTIANLGTTSLIGTPSTTTLATKGLVASSGISFNTSATDVTISTRTTEYCIVGNSTNITVNNGASANLMFDTEYADPSGMHSTVTNPDRINILSNGLYEVKGYTYWAGNNAATDDIYLSLFWIDVSTATTSNVCISTVIPKGTAATLLVSRILPMEAGDYVLLQYANISGVNLAITGATNQLSPWFSVVKLSN